MKKLFIIVFVLAWLSIGSAFIPKTVRADAPTRFERLGIYNVYNQYNSYISRVETWHDTESGVEIICMVGNTHGNPSCVLSGRNWK